MTKKRQVVLAAIAVPWVTLVGGAMMAMNKSSHSVEASLGGVSEHSEKAHAEGIEPQSTRATNEDYFPKAQKARQDENYDLAAHLYELTIHAGGRTVMTAVEGLEAMQSERSGQAEKNDDFRTAKAHLDRASQVIQQLEQADSRNGCLDTAEREIVFATKARISDHLQQLQERRKAFYEKKTRDLLIEVEGLFKVGKRPWYWNDLDDKFKDALFVLCRAWPYENEIGVDLRKELADWHATLKGEMNADDYKETMEKARIVYPYYGRADATTGG